MSNPPIDDPGVAPSPGAVTSGAPSPYQATSPEGAGPVSQPSTPPTERAPEPGAIAASAPVTAVGPAGMAASPVGTPGTVAGAYPGPPGWPVSAAPYGPPAAAKRGRAPLIILSVLSTVLLLGLGVLTVLYLNDRQTITQQRALIDSSATDLKAKSAELARTQQDLDAAKRDAEADKACADIIRSLFKQALALRSVDPQSVDLQSPVFQAMTSAAQALPEKCGLS